MIAVEGAQLLIKRHLIFLFKVIEIFLAMTSSCRDCQYSTVIILFSKVASSNMFEHISTCFFAGKRPRRGEKTADMYNVKLLIRRNLISFFQVIGILFFRR